MPLVHKNICYFISSDMVDNNNNDNNDMIIIITMKSDEYNNFDL